MPATFESFGIKFLYPDNWVLTERNPEEGDQGMTLEMPAGGFFAVEQSDEELSDDELIARVCDAIKSEYDETESETITLPGALPEERTVEFRFFYLDLLIVSQVILMKVDQRRLVVQIQAETRDFDNNELVFAAILKQLRGQI